MNYKDKTFEIDGTQIRFANNIFITVFLPCFFMIPLFGIIGKHDVISVLLRVATGVLGLMISYFVMFRRVYYWKNTIDLKDISQVKISTWDNSIDKDRNFWGRPNYRYHFPAGLNKKSNPKVIFVEIRDSKLAVGLVPENMENAIEVFTEKGIKIAEKL
jgi:hypothetical protein